MDIKLTCANNTLTVSWPTDVYYNGSVIGVPTELKQTLDDRILAKGVAFHLVMLSNTPPYVKQGLQGSYTMLSKITLQAELTGVMPLLYMRRQLLIINLNFP